MIKNGKIKQLLRNLILCARFSRELYIYRILGLIHELGSLCSLFTLFSDVTEMELENIQLELEKIRLSKTNLHIFTPLKAYTMQQDLNMLILLV